jgi:hypothetical protein
MKTIGTSIAALLFLAASAFAQCTLGQISVRSGLPPNTTTVCLTPDTILPILGEYWKQDSPAIINSNFAWLVNNTLPNPMTTRGDLIYRDASGTARLPIGLNGSALTSDGTDLFWARYSYSDLSGTPTLFAPSLHSNLHAAGQADAITPSAIGAMAALSGTGAVKLTSGAPGLVSGDASNCVHVDGSSAACQAALGFTAENSANKGAAGGYASLDINGKLPSGQLTQLAITDTYVVASQAAQLALSAHQGDICIRSDQSQTYVQNGGSAGTMADWTVLQTPSSAVQSVNGYVGIVSLSATDVGAVATSDSRLSDARTPTAHATSHKNGGADEVATVTPAANAIPKAGAGGTLAAGWFPTLNQSTSGNAATATALAADPADCAANQFAYAINASGTLTCVALTLAGPQHANQGTTTTLLHGNAAGNPAWSAVVAADIAANTITPSKMSVYEHQFTMTGSGTGGLLVDTDDQPAIWTNHSGGNMTVTKVWCRTDSATAATIQLQRDDGSPANMFSSNLSCTSAEANTLTFVSGENVLADGHGIDYQTVVAGGGAHWVSVHYTATY